MGNSFRLKSVQETIISQIKEMKEKYPERKVGLVTFTDDVDIIGDGSNPIVNIPTNQMNNYEFLKKNGETVASTQFSKSIADTYE